jgi:chemotaxis protein histidine kinase CheA
MDTTIHTSGVTSEIPSDSMESELFHVFFTEYKYLLDIYEKALANIRDVDGDSKQGFKNIFRVYHTLIGDSAYFSEFHDFTRYISESCEIVREVPEIQYNNPNLINTLHLNYSRLSSILFASENIGDPSLAHFRSFLLNF